MPTRERKEVFYQNFNSNSSLEKEEKGEEMGKWWTPTELLQFSVTSDFFFPFQFQSATSLMKFFTVPYQLWIKSKNKRLRSEISFYLHQYLCMQHCYSLLELFPIQIKVKVYPVLTSNLKILHSCVPGFIYFGTSAKKCLLKDMVV